MFLMTLMVGSLISISSISWFCSWIGLEINLLSFIPLMKTQNNKYSTESISKYFLTQAMASFMLLFSIIMFTNSKEFNFDLNWVTSTFMSSAILMKMGAAPLHFWFPEVASGISWNSNLILLTWQKIAPMILISYLNILPNLMILFIVSSSIIGSLMGLNQTCLRKILSYSSINHMSWMIAATMCSMNTWMFYFIIYSLMNLVIINTLKTWKVFFISQIYLIKNNSSKILFMMNLFSLGGLPPFPGFVPKWIMINQLSYYSMFSLTLVMIIFTLVTLFFYLRISFSTLSLFTSNSMISKSKNNVTTSIMILSTLPMIAELTLLL
uniref:NADH-ubiquinone oxidoreductase chain 2 n=1 Tax=Xylosandrus morigerus TaxID=195578 RepID=A0A343A654_9CUCU|nr:NADH dehydrogenase subunit 2 [Xylosandrus morigerus]AOY40033.1 NADH dehydrogenase subunit 2 [Xylosandrus morigerus]